MFSKQQSDINFLELTPHRRCEFDVDAEQIVTVRIPRFRKAWMLHFFVPRRKSPYIHTTLDRVGSFVWMQCDGARTVEDIADRMREEFGEDIEPVYERLKLFFRQLGGREHLSLTLPDGTSVKP